MDRIKEIKAYNQAIGDVLMKLIKKEIKGVETTYPPEALMHVFHKLQKPIDENLYRIEDILDRKGRGYDCTEKESAEIKEYLKEMKLPWEQSIVAEIQMLFPIEYSEFVDETTYH